MSTSPLPLEPRAVALARTAKFVDSFGGPLIVMSASAASGWNGVCDAAGNPVYGVSPCDYDRACASSFAVIDAGSGKALTLETPDNSAFVPHEGGALIVRWVGADDAETLIAAALGVGEDEYEEVAVLPHTGGALLMFDATSRGAQLDGERVASIDLPAGDYGVRLCTEWQGEVLGSDGAPHEVMVQVLALSRR